jgi:cell division protein FtsW (lipid II flippase)
MTAGLRRANHGDPEFASLPDAHTDFALSVSREGWGWAVIVASVMLAAVAFSAWRVRRR